MAQWRIELTTQDLVALERGMEITVSAIDEEPDASEVQIDVTISCSRCKRAPRAEHEVGG